MHADSPRVLMTADAVGGVWTYALDLAAALASANVHTTIATMGPPPDGAQVAAARRVPGLHLEPGEFRLEWMDAPWGDVDAAGRWLLALEQTIRPWIVHLNGYAHAALPWSAPVAVVGHSCLLSWADAVPGAIDSAKLQAYRSRVTRGIRRAAHVVAPTAAMLAALERHYGPLASASVIPNGRFIDAPARNGKTAAKQPLVVTAGRLWDRAKNVETVVAAAAAPGLPWPVAVAGEAGGSIPAHRGVKYVGRLTAAEMAALLERAPIFALPARYEPFGLLPLEAALAGCALVLGDIPSLREVWGDAADFVCPDDPAALRRALISLIESPVRLAVRAAAARRRARAFTARRMGVRYLGLYGELARQRSSGRRLACAS